MAGLPMLGIFVLNRKAKNKISPVTWEEQHFSWSSIYCLSKELCCLHRRHHYIRTPQPKSPAFLALLVLLQEALQRLLSPSVMAALISAQHSFAGTHATSLAVLSWPHPDLAMQGMTFT